MKVRKRHRGLSRAQRSGPQDICPECIDDPELQDFIRNKATVKACTFCGRHSRSALACDIDDVVEVISSYIFQEWEDAAEQVPYETAEGGYQTETMTTYELLRDDLCLSGNEEAIEYIVWQLPDHAWVQKNWLSMHPFDELKYGWEEFVRQIKHVTRYMLFPRRKKEPWIDDGIPPEKMLRELAVVLRLTNCVRSLKKGTRLYRCRIHKATEVPSTLADLGPPPIDKAIFSNRMSPAGISMFYAAEDEQTAIQETLDPADRRKYGTVGLFELNNSLRVADLVHLPLPATYTGNHSQWERARLRFAHAFAENLSEPIRKDGREHVDYVPTQVVTEYLRFRCRFQEGRVQGIRFKSSKNPHGVNVVLFFGHEEVVTSPLTSPSTAPIRLVKCRRIPLR